MNHTKKTPDHQQQEYLKRKWSHFTLISTKVKLGFIRSLNRSSRLKNKNYLRRFYFVFSASCIVKENFLFCHICFLLFTILYKTCFVLFFSGRKHLKKWHETKPYVKNFIMSLYCAPYFL